MRRGRDPSLLLCAAAMLAACAGGDEPIVVQLSVEPRPTPTRTPLPIPAMTEGPPPTALPTPSYEGWLTYLNEVYRYRFLYPPEATVREAQREQFGADEAARESNYARYTAQLCVIVELSYSFIAIAGPPNDSANVLDCGETNFAAYEVVSLQDHLSLGGTSYASQGYEFRGAGETLDQHFEFHVLRLGDGTSLTYGSRTDLQGTYSDYLAEKPAVFQIIQSIQLLEVPSVSRPDFANLPPLSEPVFAGEGLELYGWSPDGSVLSLSRRIPGRYAVVELHFYDIRAAERCTYPHDAVDLGFWPWSPFWLADGRFLIPETEEEWVIVSDPCDPTITPLASLFPEPIVGISAASTAALLVRGESSFWLYEPEESAVREVKGLPLRDVYTADFSPECGYLLIQSGSFDFYLINVASGELVGVVPKATYAGLGPAEARWISEDRFILSNRSPGPTLVTFTPEGIQGIQPIASTFFGLPDRSTNSAFGVGNENGFHLICCWEYYEQLLPRALLYHSETGTVEALPGQFRSFFWDDFAPGGDVLILRIPRIRGNAYYTEVWMRPVDPLGSEARVFVGAEDETNYALSHDGALLAVVTSREYTPATVLSVYSAPGGILWARWNLGVYSNFSFGWSPDDAQLAAVGSVRLRLGGQEHALFILPMP